MAGSVRILLVDDCEPWRQQVRSILITRPELGVVSEAGDGLEAVHKAQELQPDLILLDIGLPNLNGLEAAKCIRQVAPEAGILFFNSAERRRHQTGSFEHWGARIHPEDTCME